VSVQTQGTLTGLTLRGYPQTAHPLENHAGLGSLALDRYFSITPNSGAGGYSLRLCLNYDDAELGSLSESTLQLCRWQATEWICLPRSAASDTSGNLACADQVTLLSDWVVAGGSPTAVDLLRFEAWPDKRAIHVQWETGQEVDNLGFNLYRSESVDGPALQLNKTLIPSLVPPGSPYGAVYDWIDRYRLRRGQTYYYWLEDLDIYGRATLHGPVQVQASH
jgi:hypothetical protein